ncbi:MAG TPA: hypothetical protein PK294_06855 [Ignavibacteria bacterium]|nr:hypothetical protein [Ignavibacteria bacterium]
MKKLFSIFTFFTVSLFYLNASSQLSGTLSIPGNYATIKLAIEDLNTQGVGIGGVVFNVAAGHTETSSNMTISILANQPTSANTVVFQKSGAGANPLITAAAGISATADGIIKFSGADYITFNAIDLLDPNTNTGNGVMEWGYALMRASTTDGSQNNVIKNCVITLQKISSLSYGIFVANRDTNGATVVASDPDGQNSYNKLFGNTISNVYKGIVTISASTARDIDNQIGVNSENPNQITNWGGSTIASEGIRAEGQVNLKIVNNIVNGGNGTANAVVGIIATLFGTTALAPNYEISHNTVTVNSNQSSSATYGIRALATADTIRMHNNIIENCVTNYTGTATFNAMVHDGVGLSNAAYINDNIVRNNSHTGTGTSTLIGCSSDMNFLELSSNEVYGNTRTSISGTMNCLLAADAATLNCYSNEVYNNSIPNTSGTSASNLYGYINSGNPGTENIYNNIIRNLTVSGSNTAGGALTVGIRSNAAVTTTKNIYGNLIHSLSAVSGNFTTGGIFGIYSTNGASHNIYSNRIYNITNNSGSGTSGGCWVSTGTSFTIYNNFISDIKAPNSTQANGVVGIHSSTTTANSNIGIYYNSIYLTASGGSTFGSSGISVNGNATPTTANLDLRNNLVINLSTPGSSGGVTTALRRSLATLSNFSELSDNNDLYSGTPSSNRLIYFDGTGYQTINDYKNAVTPRESNSNSVSVNFVNPATGDLHLTGASVQNPNLAGMPISGISNDIDGDARNFKYPYKGADESTAFNIQTLNLTVNLEACSPVQDTLTVSLRSTVSPYGIVATDKRYLSPAGSAAFIFINASNGVNYYIVANHRNSIETWSKNGGEVFTAGSLTYDFTTAASQAFGNNQVLVSGEYSIYTGDVNQDEVVDVTDLGLIDNDASNFVTGYVVTDLNYDNVVDVTDASFADNNAAGFVSVSKP